MHVSASYSTRRSQIPRFLDCDDQHFTSLAQQQPCRNVQAQHQSRIATIYVGEHKCTPAVECRTLEHIPPTSLGTGRGGDATDPQCKLLHQGLPAGDHTCGVCAGNHPRHRWELLPWARRHSPGAQPHSSCSASGSSTSILPPEPLALLHLGVTGPVIPGTPTAGALPCPPGLSKLRGGYQAHIL